VRSKNFKLLSPCNLQVKKPESWNLFDVQKTQLFDGADRLSDRPARL
jgi:hypothetical protein